MTEAEFWKTIAIILYAIMILLMLAAAFAKWKPRSQLEADQHNMKHGLPQYQIFVLVLALLSPLGFLILSLRVLWRGEA